LNNLSVHRVVVDQVAAEVAATEVIAVAAEVAVVVKA
jgi:hypothetical protein